MNTAGKTYSFIPQSYPKQMAYLFISEGKSKVTKVVIYQYLFNQDILQKNNRLLFNFGFADIHSGGIDDKSLTDNGDAKTVFNTVLSTVPDFFTRFPDAVIRVGGSDSGEEFKVRCALDCTKAHCAANDTCKKLGRRMKLYQKYVDENFKELAETYEFYGTEADNILPDGTEGNYILEPYEVKKNYKYVVVCKK